MTRGSRLLAVSAFAVGAGLSHGDAATPVSLAPDARIPFRLVLDHAPEGGWVVQQYETFVELKFTGADLTITPAPGLLDTMEGFVSEVNAETLDGTTYLRLTFGCNCVPAVAANGQGQVTIDIVDIPKPPDAAARAVEATASGPAPLTAPRPPVKSIAGLPDQSNPTDEINVDEARERLIAQLLRAAEAGLVEMQPDAEPLAQAETEVSSKPAATPEQGGNTVSPEPPSEEELIGRVSAAAAAGEDILASISGPADGKTTARPANEPGSPAKNTANDGTSGANGAQDSEHGQSAQDWPDPESTDVAVGEYPRIPHAEPACFDNAVFDFSQVPDHDEIADRIAGHRRALIGEFDRIDSDEAIALAKLYIFAGFTVEARQVLENFAVEHELAPIYFELSQLRDGVPLSAEAAILKADCVGEQALWRALAAALTGQGDQAIQAEMAAGRALERMPVELRENIAAWIGNAAALSGDWDSARRMQAVVKRAATSMPKMSGRAHLMSAKLAFWNDEKETGIAHLRSASASDPKSATEALFALGDLALRDPDWERSRTERLRDDLGAMARLMTDTADGQRAFELEIKLANRAQSHGESMNLLSHGVETGLVEETRQYALLTEVITDPAAEADADPLALHYLDDPDKFAPALVQPGFRTELARSMIDLAVPRLAVDVLAEEDYADPHLTLQLADALVEAGETREAMEVISKLPDGAEKTRLLASTLRSSGEPEQAVSHLDDALPVTSGTDDEIDLLKIKAEAAQEAGDLNAALDALEEIFAITPTADRAEEIAMLALAAGREGLPKSVRTHLEQNSPAVLSSLEPLFGAGQAPAKFDSPESINGYLKRLNAEETAIEELLNNG